MENKSTQNEAVAAVVAERRWQELEAKKDKISEPLPVSAEVLCVQYLLVEAAAGYYKNGIGKDEAAVDVLRRIAGVCFRAMEHHGVIERIW
jgi:hypothetical protein